MKKVILMALAVGMLTACTDKKQNKENDMVQKLELTQEWDKVFPLNEKVNHKKVTFETQYGLTLAFDPSYTGESSGEPRRRQRLLRLLQDPTRLSCPLRQ